MNEIVLWSGGVDSTLILHNLLKEGKKVMALTVDHGWNPLIKQESQARDEIAKLLPDFARREYVVDHKDTPEYEKTPENWFEEIFLHIENNSNVYMGLHKDKSFGKDSLEFYKPIINLFKRKAKKKKLKLKLQLPLIDLSKTQIKNRIKKLGLLDYCIITSEKLKENGTIGIHTIPNCSNGCIGSDEFASCPCGCHK